MRPPSYHIHKLLRHFDPWPTKTHTFTPCNRDSLLLPRSNLLAFLCYNIAKQAQKLIFHQFSKFAHLTELSAVKQRFLFQYNNVGTDISCHILPLVDDPVIIAPQTVEHVQIQQIPVIKGATDVVATKISSESTVNGKALNTKAYLLIGSVDGDTVVAQSMTLSAGAPSPETATGLFKAQVEKLKG